MATCLFSFHIVIQLAFNRTQYEVDEGVGALTFIMVVKMNNVTTEQDISFNIVTNEDSACETIVLD